MDFIYNTENWFCKIKSLFILLSNIVNELSYSLNGHNLRPEFCMKIDENFYKSALLERSGNPAIGAYESLRLVQDSGEISKSWI